MNYREFTESIKGHIWESGKLQECKFPSAKPILNGICIVTVKVLNSYKKKMISEL